jgi:multidrug efflux pump subunit AcrA (membrane-fusion protein)
MLFRHIDSLLSKGTVMTAACSGYGIMATVVATAEVTVVATAVAVAVVWLM